MAEFGYLARLLLRSPTQSFGAQSAVLYVQFCYEAGVYDVFFTTLYAWKRKATGESCIVTGHVDYTFVAIVKLIKDERKYIK